ncbi:MAG: glycosyltransferase [Sphingobacteriaceae bacterium]|nr:MAG: glycosyltransferase [Sphingobacteriaceae bacterium]
MCNPLVSIIIPVYNAEKYLAQSISSALNQTWQNIEIIVVDNESTDASFSIAKSFDSACVKVYSQQKKSASAARNKGIKEASGQYIQFLDADDLIEKNKIEKQLQVINFSTNQLAICPVIHFPDGSQYHDFEPSLYEQKFYQSNADPVKFLLKLYGAENNMAGMIALHAWLIPAELIKKAGFWNENLTVDDDGEFFCRIVLNAEKIICTNDSACYYRKYQHYRSLSGQSNLTGFSSRLKAAILKQQHLAKHCNPQLLNNIFAQHYWSIAVQCYPQYKKLSAIALKRAKEGSYKAVKYNGGPASIFLSKILGWRLLRYITYYRYGF